MKIIHSFQRSFILIIISLISFSLSSCSEKDTDIYKMEDDIVSIRTNIKNELTTRINLDKDGKGSFTEGDEISFLIYPELGKNKQEHLLIYNEMKWKPVLYWNNIPTGQSTFIGFYPSIQKTDKESFIHKISTNQDLIKEYELSDLLYARTICSKGEEVNLQFGHVMCRLNVTLNNSGEYTQDELDHAELEISAYTEAIVEKETGNVLKVITEEEKIKFQKISNENYQVILTPQVIPDSWRNDCWIKINIAGKSHKIKFPVESKEGYRIESLQQGKEISLSITLTKEDKSPENTESEWANKTFWVHGIQNPPFEKWGYAFTIPYKIIGLEWEPEYGWYDCTKRDPVSPTFDDNHLCWAATCSNMIYWWIDQNKENIERYGKYNGPREYIDAFDCEIFQFFKDNFTNLGGYVQSGLDFFFKGIPVKGGINDATSIKKHPGFFSDVFEERMTRVGIGRNLNEDLKHAFKNREAIGLSIDVYAGRGAHSISVWGAEFDEKGEACVLYITENNDNELVTQGISPMQPQKLCPTGLYPKRIKKDEHGMYYMESSSVGRYTIRITETQFLSTKEKEWKQFFDKSR